MCECFPCIDTVQYSLGDVHLNVVDKNEGRNHTLERDAMLPLAAIRTCLLHLKKCKAEPFSLRTWRTGIVWHWHEICSK